MYVFDLLDNASRLSTFSSRFLCSHATTDMSFHLLFYLTVNVESGMCFHVPCSSQFRAEETDMVSKTWTCCASISICLCLDEDGSCSMIHVHGINSASSTVCGMCSFFLIKALVKILLPALDSYISSVSIFLFCFHGTDSTTLHV